MFRLDFKPSTISGEEGRASYIEGSLELWHGDYLVYTWRANSGGHGKGCLPHNIYTLEKAVEFKPWWSALKAKFKTDRTALGLHGDGGVKGSLGCLVLMAEDDIFFNTLVDIFETQDKILLTVY